MDLGVISSDQEDAACAITVTRRDTEKVVVIEASDSDLAAIQTSFKQHATMHLPQTARAHLSPIMDLQVLPLT